MFEITKIKYSKTITSLRGISILGVLLYHAKFDFFKGGYLGVDVFFVISGYLIGNIILSKLTTQTFFFKDFYIRRARRLLPALFASLFFTYVLNYFLLLPSDFEQFKNSIVYVLTFTGNIYFGIILIISLHLQTYFLYHTCGHLELKNNFIYCFRYFFS